MWNKWLLNLCAVIIDIYFPISLFISIKVYALPQTAKTRVSTPRPYEGEEKREGGRGMGNLQETGLPGLERSLGDTAKAALLWRMMAAVKT